MEAELMSYNQNDFQDKAHMEMFISQVEKQVRETHEEFAKAGLLSFTITQV